MQDIEMLFKKIILAIHKEIMDEFGIQNVPKVYVSGFRLTIGPDGIPRIERFGNVKIRRGAEGPVREVRYSEDMEPLVDIYEEKDTITVVAEIPGVEKENIKLKGRGSKLIIDARNSRKYYKEIDLPHDVDVSKAKATYKNGVLEIKLPKVKKEEYEIDIEIDGNGSQDSSSSLTMDMSSSSSSDTQRDIQAKRGLEQEEEKREDNRSTTGLEDLTMLLSSSAVGVSSAIDTSPNRSTHNNREKDKNDQNESDDDSSDSLGGCNTFFLVM